jgi:hypothetical protein
MPRQVAASHAEVMTAPATYGWPLTSAPAAVPASTVAASPSVRGKWHGQITKAPISNAKPLFLVCLAVGEMAHAALSLLIEPAD